MTAPGPNDLRPATWDLIVVGANPAGLSLAAEARRAGLRRVLVLEPGESAVPMRAIGHHGLTVQFLADVERFTTLAEAAMVETGSETFRAVAAVDARPVERPSAPAPFPIDPKIADRVHDTVAGFDPRDADVLVVGDGERAVADLVRLEEAGARVVLAFRGRLEDLSQLGREALSNAEHARQATILWLSVPSAIEAVGGHPMVFFQDRRTPDLQFDHVVLAYTPVEDAPSDRLSLGPGALHPSTAWDELVARFADRWPPLLPAIQSTRLRHTPEIAALREELYNATITAFEHWHTDLWVLRIRPDAADTSHRAGQYATLGLGYWEPRVDDADESLGDEQRARLIRRSYSISSRVLDEHGYLVDPSREDEVEFYIVHVRPDAARIPALTPRLADKRAGDRIYLGPKVTGRYTLDAVTDPFSDVVFLATGTGEAPHNAMIGELLRKGHHGSIVSVVSVRRLEDLGYRRTHQVLAERWPNYTYVVVPTREPGWEKRYVQDVISSGELAGTLAHGLDPARTHVFACGNPSMIGLPEWDGDTPVFPATVGIAGLLTERGFTLDRRGTIGTIHYEEYW